MGERDRFQNKILKQTIVRIEGIAARIDLYDLYNKFLTNEVRNKERNE